MACLISSVKGFLSDSHLKNGRITYSRLLMGRIQDFLKGGGMARNF